MKIKEGNENSNQIRINQDHTIKRANESHGPHSNVQNATHH